MNHGDKRSPNYPSVRLDICIDKLRKIYNKYGTQIITDLDKLGKELGYSSYLSGRDMLVSSVSYGLLDKIDRGYQITQLCVVILGDSRDAADGATKQAALRPGLFLDIFNRTDHTENEILKFLHGLGFTVGGAMKASRSFRAAIGLARLDRSHRMEQRVLLDTEREIPRKREETVIETGDEIIWRLGQGVTCKILIQEGFGPLNKEHLDRLTQKIASHREIVG